MKKLILCALIGAFLIIPSNSAHAEDKDTYLSDEIVEICETAQEKYNIAAPLLEALIEAESSGRQYAHTDSSVGLCQLNVKYQYALALSTMGTSTVDLYDPYTNVFTACAYINQLVQELDAYGEPMQVLKAYNEGPENSQRVYADVQSYGTYANKIIERAAEITRAQDAKEEKED